MRVISAKAAAQQQRLDAAMQLLRTGRPCFLPKIGIALALLI
jgi:hypothetical protein